MTSTRSSRLQEFWRISKLFEGFITQFITQFLSAENAAISREFGAATDRFAALSRQRKRYDRTTRYSNSRLSGIIVLDGRMHDQTSQFGTGPT
jgi:hypothetical protein